MYFVFNQKAEIGKIDENGFLRIKLRLGSLGILKYIREEMPEDIQEKYKDKDVFSVFRNEDSIFTKDSIESLEGIPILAFDHQWILPDNFSNIDLENEDLSIPHSTPKKSQVGQVAGVAYREGDFLVGKAVITDKNIIEQIRQKELIEISPAYRCSDIEKSGEWKGQHYDFIQGPAIYNHILLCEPNTARGGRDLKIINKKRGEDVVANVAISTKYGLVSVSQESQGIMEKLLEKEKSLETDLNKMTDKVSKLEPEVEEKAKLLDKIKGIEKEKEKLEGEKKALETELENAKSPAKMQDMIKELQATDKVIDAIGDPDLEKRLKPLSIQDKKKEVIKYYFDKNKREIDKDVTDEFVAGAWSIVSDSIKKTEDKFVSTSKTLDTRLKMQTRSKEEILGYKKKEDK